jgi:ABC-type branched-subunit amino acid transport system substrate-binding protein
VLLVGLLLLSGLFVAACGSSDDSSTSSQSSSSTGSSTQAASKPTGTAVKIGIVTPSGTPVTNDDAGVASAKAAIAAINDAGGLQGHPVELDWCNDKGDPNLTAACGRQMVKDGVIALVGGIPQYDANLLPVTRAAGIPQIGANPRGAEGFNSPNSYLFDGGSFFLFQGLTTYIAEQGRPTAIVCAENDIIRATIDDNMKPIMEKAGQQFTSITYVPPTQADFAPIVAAAQRGGAKDVIVMLGAEQWAQFVQSAKSAGAKFERQYNAGPPNTEVKAALGDDLDTVQYASAFPPFTNAVPAMADYLKQLKAEEDSGDKNADIGLQSTLSFHAWLGVQVINDLVKSGQVKELTPQGLMDALNSAKDIDLGGAMPAWTPNAKGIKGFDRVSNRATYIIGFKGGEPYLITKQPIVPEVTS